MNAPMLFTSKCYHIYLCRSIYADIWRASRYGPNVQEYLGKGERVMSPGPPKFLPCTPAQRASSSRKHKTMQRGAENKRITPIAILINYRLDSYPPNQKKKGGEEEKVGNTEHLNI